MKTLSFIILAALISLSGFSVWAYTTEDCMVCHREGSPESALHISVREFESSIHGREGMDCTDCHNGVTDGSHGELKGSGTNGMKIRHESLL